MSERETAAVPTVVDELDLCCKGKKCPKIRLLSTGEVEVFDAEAGGAPVRFTAEQASALRAFLVRRGL